MQSEKQEKIDYTINKGIAEEHCSEAAFLYAFAFEKKFQKLIGPPELVAEIFRDNINLDYAFSAISSDNELLGIVGFYDTKSSLMNIKMSNLIIKYGLFSGIYKKIIISILFFKKRDNDCQLLMDGIVVKKKGVGIGTELINKLIDYAILNKMKSIKLDVIDDNPAKKLYEKLGFIKISYFKNIKLVKYLIGVRGFTTMVKNI